MCRLLRVRGRCGACARGARGAGAARGGLRGVGVSPRPPAPRGTVSVETAAGLHHGRLGPAAGRVRYVDYLVCAFVKMFVRGVGVEVTRAGRKARGSPRGSAPSAREPRPTRAAPRRAPRTHPGTSGRRRARAPWRRGFCPVREPSLGPAPGSALWCAHGPLVSDSRVRSRGRCLSPCDSFVTVTPVHGQTEGRVCTAQPCFSVCVCARARGGRGCV